MARWGVLALLVVVVAYGAEAQQKMIAPVIGVLTQDSLGHNPGKSYLAASYVKFLESAGARVVPVHYEASREELTSLFQQLNGLLIPGGSQVIANPSNPFLLAAKVFYDLAVDANAKGDFFPIWGTCQGFQTLSVLTEGNSSVLATGFDSENLPLPLTFTPAAKTSKLLSSAPSTLFDALGSQPITMNNHHDGVTPTDFGNSAALSSTYTILSTNVDRRGRAFISTMEGKTLPFFATQWHPEKNAFEWDPDELIPHSAIAVEACSYMARFFVDQARNSTHIFPQTQLQSAVIWNFEPIYTGLQGSDFTQVYAWN